MESRLKAAMLFEAAFGPDNKAERQGMIEKCLELDLLVAQHVRIRCAPGLVFIQKIPEYPIPVIGRKVHGLEWYAENLANCANFFQVLFGAAVRVGIVLFPVLHEQTGDEVAGAFQQ